MQTIANAATQADYAAALQLGPDNFEAITAQIFNATCVYSVFVLGGSMDSGTGDWGPELYAVANDSTSTSVNVTRCGGIRFRTNPATPSTVARVNAWAWKDGEPQITGLTVPGGALSSGGNLSGGTVVTGIIPATGTVATAGTGFTYTHTNGTGIYVFTFTTPFSAAPIIVGNELAISGGGNIRDLSFAAVTASGFTAYTDNNGTLTDTAFNFLAQAVA